MADTTSTETETSNNDYKRNIQYNDSHYMKSKKMWGRDIFKACSQEIVDNFISHCATWITILHQDKRVKDTFVSPKCKHGVMVFTGNSDADRFFFKAGSKDFSDYYGSNNEAKTIVHLGRSVSHIQTDNSMHGCGLANSLFMFGCGHTCEIMYINLDPLKLDPRCSGLSKSAGRGWLLVWGHVDDPKVQAKFQENHVLSIGFTFTVDSKSGAVKVAFLDSSDAESASRYMSHMNEYMKYSLLSPAPDKKKKNIDAEKWKANVKKWIVKNLDSLDAVPEGSGGSSNRVFSLAVGFPDQSVIQIEDDGKRVRVPLIKSKNIGGVYDIVSLDKNKNELSSMFLHLHRFYTSEILEKVCIKIGSTTLDASGKKATTSESNVYSCENFNAVYEDFELNGAKEYEEGVTMFKKSFIAICMNSSSRGGKTLEEKFHVESTQEDEILAGHSTRSNRTTPNVEVLVKVTTPPVQKTAKPLTYMGHDFTTNGKGKEGGCIVTIFKGRRVNIKINSVFTCKSLDDWAASNIKVAIDRKPDGPDYREMVFSLFKMICLFKVDHNGKHVLCEPVNGKEWNDLFWENFGVYPWSLICASVESYGTAAGCQTLTRDFFCALHGLETGVVFGASNLFLDIDKTDPVYEGREHMVNGFIANAILKANLQGTFFKSIFQRAVHFEAHPQEAVTALNLGRKNTKTDSRAPAITNLRSKLLEMFQERFDFFHVLEKHLPAIANPKSSAGSSCTAIVQNGAAQEGAVGAIQHLPPDVVCVDAATVEQNRVRSQKSSNGRKNRANQFHVTVTEHLGKIREAVLEDNPHDVLQTAVLDALDTVDDFAAFKVSKATKSALYMNNNWALQMFLKLLSEVKKKRGVDEANVDNMIISALYGSVAPPARIATRRVFGMWMDEASDWVQYKTGQVGEVRPPPRQPSVLFTSLPANSVSNQAGPTAAVDSPGTNASSPETDVVAGVQELSDEEGEEGEYEDGEYEVGGDEVVVLDAECVAATDANAIAPSAKDAASATESLGASLKESITTPDAPSPSSVGNTTRRAVAEKSFSFGFCPLKRNGKSKFVTVPETRDDANTPGSSADHAARAGSAPCNNKRKSESLPPTSDLDSETSLDDTSVDGIPIKESNKNIAFKRATIATSNKKVRY